MLFYFDEFIFISLVTFNVFWDSYCFLAKKELCSKAMLSVVVPPSFIGKEA